jgi:hypothetical protein
MNSNSIYKNSETKQLDKCQERRFLTSSPGTAPYEPPIAHICAASLLYILSCPSRIQCSDDVGYAQILPL